MFTFDQERVSDAPAISNLLDSVFGLDRQSKASYALRRSGMPVAALCQVVRMSERLVASIQFWPVRVSDMITGEQYQALLLGPLAVDPHYQCAGIGSRLMKRSLSNAESLGHQRILLVGDICFYGRFGFEPALPSYVTLPGGRDARRLLVKQSATLPSLPAVGRVERLVSGRCLEPHRELAFAS